MTLYLVDDGLRNLALVQCIRSFRSNASQRLAQFWVTQMKADVVGFTVGRE